jgi:hypothetical protein
MFVGEGISGGAAADGLVQYQVTMCEVEEQAEKKKATDCVVGAHQNHQLPSVQANNTYTTFKRLLLRYHHHHHHHFFLSMLLYCIPCNCTARHQQACFSHGNTFFATQRGRLPRLRQYIHAFFITLRVSMCLMCSKATHQLHLQPACFGQDGYGTRQTRV